MYPIAGQDPGSTATSRCSQSQAQDGHDGIGSDIAPAKRYFKVHWPNRSSFFPVDWHSDHHKKKKKLVPVDLRSTLNGNRQRVPVDLLHDEGRSRGSWSCAIFLLALQPDRARVTMMSAHAGKLTWTPFCLFLRSLGHPPSLHIHLKRTSMCGFIPNPPPPPQKIFRSSGLKTHEAPYPM